MRWHVLAALVIILAMVLMIGSDTAVAQNIQKDESLIKGETKPVLDPKQFTDPRVRKAYQIAKDIPWVLDSIHCFCYCKENPLFKHKSLLSCYVDKHAVT